MSKRNENRPGYKKTKVGWIPRDWNFLPLRRLAQQPLMNGLFKRPHEYGLGTLLVNVTDTYKGIKIDATSLGRVQTSQIELAKYRNLYGDLFFVRSSLKLEGIGNCCVYLDDQIQSVFECHLIRFRPDQSKVDPLFAAYLFKSSKVRKQMLSFAQTTTMTTLPQGDFKRCMLPLPPLPEQKKIAEILSAWDEAIDKTHKLIDAKKRRKKALMQQLLTDKKRLPGFNESWEEYHLGELFDERREVNCEHLPLLAITGSRGVILATEIVRKDSSSTDKSRYKRIAPGDIGYNTMRMWQGVSAVSGLEGIVSPAYTICIPKETVDVSFMGCFFKFSPVVNLFRRFSQGLVNDTLNLKFHHFAQIKVIIPCLDEQQAISKVLRIADDEIKKLENKLAALEKQKRGLMQKLLTGEVRVKT